jgi:hypothetical protein
MNLKDLNIDHNRLADICRRYRVASLEAFGSFTRGDAGAQSDIDILVTFEPGAQLGLRYVELQQELEALYGRPVDLLTRSAVERSPNKYFRHFTLRRTEPIFERS